MIRPAGRIPSVPLPTPAIPSSEVSPWIDDIGRFMSLVSR
jgi:hypothetical protein